MADFAVELRFMEDLLKHLREETSDLHRKLDQIISRENPTSSRISYSSYLTRFHSALARCWSLDWALMEALGLPESARRKDRYRALGADLEGLGISFPKLPDDSVGTMSVGTSVGCLYVLEGSIHGGGQLLLDLKNRPTDLAGGNLRFLRGFGEHNATAWRAFASWLRALELPPGFTADARCGAATAFRHFIASFDSTPWNPPATA